MSPNTSRPGAAVRLAGARPFLASVIVLGLTLLASLPSVALAKESETKKSFNVPVGDAGSTLKQIAQQAGQQVVYPAQEVRGVQTTAVRGNYTLREALDKMLTETNLEAVFDEKSSTFAVRKADPNAQRVALEKSSDRPLIKKSEIKDGVLKLEKMEVTGSRIHTLIGEQSIQPVLTITQRDIQRYGISSLGEIFRYIPQVTSSTFGQVIQTTNRFGSENATLTSNRITATLRGAPAGGTLLLVNGRRVPKSGQESGADAYDLSGIPLSAIDHIDVLLDGASAIYGADAVGGVINVILKKHYRGTELRLSYDNTFDKDAAIMTATLSHGFSSGKLSGALVFSWERAHAMMWPDRWFLQTFDRRPFGGSDLRDPTSGGTGQIRAVSGNLPGLSKNAVGIPVGANGTTATVADYAAALLPGPVDFGPTTTYSTPYNRRSLSGNTEYALAPWLRVFGDARWADSELFSVNSASYVANNILIPAGAPGNPFGVPVRLTKIFTDVPGPRRTAEVQHVAFTAGLRGDLPGDWHFESRVSLARTMPDLEVAALSLNAARVAQAFAGGQNPVLLYDSTRGISPNLPGTIEALAIPPALSAERAETWTYDFHADGPIFDLPGGALKAAAGLEYREEYVDFPLQLATSSNARARNRYTSGYFAEFKIPVLSAKQQIPLVNHLEFRAAGRYDRYSVFADSITPNYGVLYRPFPWLMLRGSFGKGYKVPTLSQLYAPESETNVFFFVGSSSFLDPLRDYEPVFSSDEEPLPVTRGGNSGLVPETSKNSTAGLVLEVPGIKGLSFSAGYFDTEYIDRAGLLSLTDRISLFPDTVTRGERRPGDPVGWPGPVIGYEDKPVNIAYERISGWDVNAKYSILTRWGEISANVAASRITRREVRAAANLPPTTASTADTLPMQSSGSLFWSRGPWDVGTLFTYRDRFRPLNTATARFTPSAIVWDFQASYQFSESGWVKRNSHAWWGHALAESKLSVTIFNVFDRLPPFAPSTLPDNTVVDSRLRRYAVSLSKKF